MISGMRAERERCCSKEARIIAECGNDDADISGNQGEGPLFDQSCGRQNERVSNFAQPATQHDHFGVEDVREVDQTRSDVSSTPCDDAGRQRVATSRCICNIHGSNSAGPSGAGQSQR